MKAIANIKKNNSIYEGYQKELEGTAMEDIKTDYENYINIERGMKEDVQELGLTFDYEIIEN